VRGVILVSLENASFLMVAWMDGRTAVCHNKPVFWWAYKNEWPISWNYEYIIFGQIIFQNFHQFKAFVGLSNCRIIATAPFLVTNLRKLTKKSKSLFTEITCYICALFWNPEHIFTKFYINLLRFPFFKNVI
jgi:hypothetical protein